MAREKIKGEGRLVKQAHSRRPEWSYYRLEPSKAVTDSLLSPHVFRETCDRACTKVVSLLPKTRIAGHTGMGYQMVNVDGFRTINAYVISDPLNSTLLRGFSLELSFAPNPFVPGIGVVGETSFFFDFDAYFEPGSLSHRTARCETSDLTTAGGLPWIGGIDLAHVLRAPVMGPYVRASVFNEDSAARNAQVVAYLST